MKSIITYGTLFLLFTLLSSHLLLQNTHHPNCTVWGFYGHKLINRLAVFTLPSDLIEFYKSHINYVTEHAVDADKRRYAISTEAINHYMDIDHFGDRALEKLPQEFAQALLAFVDIRYTRGTDTASLWVRSEDFPNRWKWQMDTTSISEKQLLDFMRYRVIREFDNEHWTIPCDFIRTYFSKPEFTCDNIFIFDTFTRHGILPYNLQKVYRQLVSAFIQKDVNRILRYSADIGHYIGDAHVPLHTSKNYNGQLTNQDGIHAFWESRIPELLAEAEWDFVVGPAEFIPDIKSFVWQIVKESNVGVQKVLQIEKELSTTYPQDEQFCFEERLGVNTKIQCTEYTKAYNAQLDDQVEERMRDAILALGSIWMSAWVEAGQPDLQQLKTQQAIEEPTIDSSNSRRRYEIRTHE